MSSDGIRFYVQRSVLSQNSANSFGGLFGSPHSVAGEVPTFEVQEVHATMNVILLALYDLPITAGLAVLDTALSALTKVYEVPSKTLLYSPTTSLAAAILIHVEDHPLAVYVLAAKHDAYLLAAAASEHLYSLAFSSLSEEDAVQMGPLYLKRLYMLLHGRREALKTLVARPPDQHAPTPGAPTCNSSLRARIAQDWTLAAAEIVWKGGYVVSYRSPPSMTLICTSSLMQTGCAAAGDCSGLGQSRGELPVL